MFNNYKSMFSRFEPELIRSLEDRGRGYTLDKLISIEKHIFVLVLLTFLLVEHQLELVCVHRAGFESTEGSA